mgnify:CR=1 FL=1
METVAAIESVSFFVLAGLCEIGEGYLVWLLSCIGRVADHDTERIWEEKIWEI